MDKLKINKIIAKYMENNIYLRTLEEKEKCDKECNFPNDGAARLCKHLMNLAKINAFQPYDFEYYTKSLDACVPVVEKLHHLKKFPKMEFTLSCIRGQWEVYWCTSDSRSDFQDLENESPSLALATALAMAIKELDNE